MTLNTAPTDFVYAIAGPNCLKLLQNIETNAQKSRQDVLDLADTFNRSDLHTILHKLEKGITNAKQAGLSLIAPVIQDLEKTLTDTAQEKSTTAQIALLEKTILTAKKTLHNLSDRCNDTHGMSVITGLHNIADNIADHLKHLCKDPHDAVLFKGASVSFTFKGKTLPEGWIHDTERKNQHIIMPDRKNSATGKTIGALIDQSLEKINVASQFNQACQKGSGIRHLLRSQSYDFERIGDQAVIKCPKIIQNGTVQAFVPDDCKIIEIDTYLKMKEEAGLLPVRHIKTFSLKAQP